MKNGEETKRSEGRTKEDRPRNKKKIKKMWAFVIKKKLRFGL